MMVRLSFPQRLVLNCVGCGFEAPFVAVGTDPVRPDETYDDRCWCKPENAVLRRLTHTHLNGRDCGQESEN